MFIAQEKKKSNIIEYVLYLWQVENIIRACQFDVNIIEQNVINQMGLDANEKSLVIDWYTDLVKQMKSQALQQDGHLAFTKEIIVELAMLHQTLLKKSLWALGMLIRSKLNIWFKCNFLE